MKSLFLFFCTIAYCQAYDSAHNNILLVVNYNWPFYHTIAHIEAFYKDFFPNIVFYGPKRGNGVHVLVNYYWYFAYRILADAMIRYPDYDGYLYINDDVMLNLWNFDRFDSNKIWFVWLKPIAWAYASRSKDWCWWKSSMGSSAIRPCLQDLPDLYKKNYIENMGQNNLTHGGSDVLYIPQRLRTDYINLAHFFYDYRVILEIAMPSICCCLESIDRWEIFNAKYLWGPEQKKLFDLYSKELDYIHPVKLTKKENVEFVKKQLGIDLAL